MPRILPLTLAVLLLALALSCGRREAQPEPEIAFVLELGSGFNRQLQWNNGELFRIDYLQGDEIGKPRLTVHLLPRELSLEEHLAEAMLVYERMDILENGPAQGLRAINAVGMGQTLVYQPFPEKLPDLELFVDLRVYFHDDQVFLFTWQQGPGAVEARDRYVAAMAHLRFLDDPPPSGQASP